MTTALTEREVTLMRTLRINDLTDNPIGLNANAINASSERLGHPIRMPVGDIRRMVNSLRTRGLVRQVKDDNGRKSYRLTRAGMAAIRHIPTART